MDLRCTKALWYIICNPANIEHNTIDTNQNETKVEKGDKKVSVKMTGPVASANFYQPAQYCLSCNLCPGKSCVISPMEQSNIEKLFISYLYNKMYYTRLDKMRFERTRD